MNGQIVIVTGAASGIGKHLVGGFCRRGARVLATDVNEAGLRDAASENQWNASQVLLTKLDVTDEHAWEAAITKAEQDLGRMNVLLNVAGMLAPHRVLDLTSREINLHLGVNVKGTVLGTQAIARRMVTHGGGHIVNFGSLASLAPVPGLSLYCASKFAVRGFSIAAAIELKDFGVAVSLVMPDAVQTPMLDLQVEHEEAALTFSGPRPLTVEEIERAVFDEVLPKRPLEVTIPLARGLLARIASSAPELGRALYPFLKKKGLAAQEKARKR